MNKHYISWEKVDKLVQYLVPYILTLPVTGIYGLSRGGLIPGVMLSHALNLPYYNTYRDGCLVVDDICDSGRTFHRIQSNVNAVFPEAHSLVYTATLHLRSTATYTPTVFASTINNDDWIVYPWEREDSKQEKDGTPTD